MKFTYGIFALFCLHLSLGCSATEGVGAMHQAIAEAWPSGNDFSAEAHCREEKQNGAGGLRHVCATRAFFKRKLEKPPITLKVTHTLFDFSTGEDIVASSSYVGCNPVENTSNGGYCELGEWVSRPLYIAADRSWKAGFRLEIELTSADIGLNSDSTNDRWETSFDVPAFTPETSPPGPVADYTGVCIKTTVVNLGDKDILPAPVASTVDLLRNLQDAPGDAMVRVLVDTNIPDISAWLADPANSSEKSIIKALLDTFISDFYASVVPPQVNQVIMVLDKIGALLETMQLKSQLVFRNYDPATRQAESQELFYAVTFSYGTTTEVFKFPPSTLALTKIVGGKKISNITPMNAPQADYGYALIHGGDLPTIPMGDIFVEAIQKMILKPLTGFATFADALANVVPCDAISRDPTDSGVVVCKAMLNAVVEAALSPIKNFKLENVVVGHATATGFDTSTTQPTVDYTTSRIEGTQPIAFTDTFGVTVLIQAPYECLRTETPELAVTW